MGISERRKFRRTALYSRPIWLWSLRLGWVVIVIWGEVGVYFWSLSSCKWPELKGARREKPTHVLLASDPQVRHPSVLWGERSWLKSFEQYLYDSNLKRSWHVTRRLSPHAAFFLGDMLSSGKYVRSEAEYKKYWRKFQAIFHLDASFPRYYLPGNNDVGMGVAHSSPQNVRAHYGNSVGPFNHQVVIRDHVFICLDAPSLVDEDYQRSASGMGFEKWTPLKDGPVDFVKSVSTEGRPAILLTHIPLARPDTATCGPIREKGSIRKGVGHGYQNTLGKQTTAFLLQSLRPAAIFSGDNRDYCEYNHPVKVADRESEERSQPIREVTIKSFSMSNHIQRPGFQLLSLVDPSPSGKSFLDAPCHLPDVTRVYTSLYAPTAILTVIFLFVLNTYRARKLRGTLAPLSLSPRSSGTNTPLHPGSSLWSPYTPAIPLSPRSALPASLRTPTTAPGPTMRAASRPATPLASPRLAPIGFPHHQTPHDEEEEDTLYPTQYALQRNGHISDGEDWPSRGDDPAPAYFLPVPGGKPPMTMRGWAWSWTFVFRGRRRRMTISAPSWNGIRELLAQLAPGGDADMILRRRGAFLSTVLDGLNILWPTLFVWILIAWWTF
ncbi:hypothetical protein C8J57DRAFT_1496224 [Mycena rebaudengoi]|nr:hypothetical protein C8J57DRAFT_1496224 [Mycena rebaudengoi]